MRSCSPRKRVHKRVNRMIACRRRMQAKGHVLNCHVSVRCASCVRQTGLRPVWLHDHVQWQCSESGLAPLGSRLCRAACGRCRAGSAAQLSPPYAKSPRRPRGSVSDFFTRSGGRSTAVRRVEAGTPTPLILLLVTTSTRRSQLKWVSGWLAGSMGGVRVTKIGISLSIRAQAQSMEWRRLPDAV